MIAPRWHDKRERAVVQQKTGERKISRLFALFHFIQNKNITAKTQRTPRITYETSLNASFFLCALGVFAVKIISRKVE
ncbi:MAG: hypothetical protein HY070_03485 [Chloroflexi bacterium]|nr:hypothetical protein [Chloroflexota bacterium]MBI3741670.1 hypothetical protein [Chloroflexota bacterium]